MPEDSSDRPTLEKGDDPFAQNPIPTASGSSSQEEILPLARTIEAVLRWLSRAFPFYLFVGYYLADVTPARLAFIAVGLAAAASFCTYTYWKVFVRGDPFSFRKHTGFFWALAYLVIVGILFAYGTIPAIRFLFP